MTVGRVYRAGLGGTKGRVFREGLTSAAAQTVGRVYRTGLASAALTATTKGRVYRTGLASVGINQGPIVSAGAAQTVESGAMVTLVGTDADDDGTVVSRVWLLDGVSMGTSPILNVRAPVVITDTVLSYVYAATDDDGSTTQAITQITVRRATIRSTTKGYVIRRVKTT